MTDRGRRIYIHEFSFRHLCRCSPEASRLVQTALLRSSAVKMLNRHFVEDGVLSGVVQQEKADSFLADLARDTGGDLTNCFRRLGFHPSLPAQRNNLFPLLAADEVISASCFEDGYFTFATNAAAAKRMFDDNVPMKALRASLLEADFDPFPELLLLRGRCLVYYEAPNEIGPETAKSYYRFLSSRVRSIPPQSSDRGLLIDEAIHLVRGAVGNALSSGVCSDHKFAHGAQQTIEALLPKVVEVISA